MFHFTNQRKILLLLPVILLLSAGAAFAQGTAFTFQGKLGDSGSPVNGTFDMQFKLFDAADPNSSTQIGTTITLNNPLVQVTNGVFTVELDFGAAALPGADRFLEIGLRHSSADPYTVLSPRTKINSTPYSIRSLNASNSDALSSACLSCVQNSQIDSMSARKLTGTIPVTSLPSGSGNYIQNATAQQTADFNINGTGTANIFSATQFNFGPQRVLSAPGTDNFFVGPGTGALNAGANNSFFGVGTGNSNTAGNDNSMFGSEAGKFSNGNANSFFGKQAGFNNRGDSNSFFGASAGHENSSGLRNSFFGASAGISNTTGNDNSFFGQAAGAANTTPGANSFFGSSAGKINTTGEGNSFFGSQAGQSNTTGSSNNFFGTLAGFANTTGNFNSFFGGSAGTSNTTGFANSFFGNLAGAGNTTANDNSFFGHQAGEGNTTGSSNSFFGSGAGFLNTTASNNSFFGRHAGRANTMGASNSFFGSNAGLLNTTSGDNSFFGKDSGFSNATGAANSFFGSGAGSASTGGGNSFFGFQAGQTLQSGNYNTFIGIDANFDSLNATGTRNTLIGASARASAGLLNSTAIGADSYVTESYSLVLGSIGVGRPPTLVGIGTTAPKSALHIGANSGQILLGDAGCPPGFTGIGFASRLSGCTNFSLLGNGTDTIINRPTGGIIAFRESNATQFSIAPGGLVSIATLGSGGTATLCRNTSGQISSCAELQGDAPDTTVRSVTRDVILRSQSGLLTLESTGRVKIGFLSPGGITSLCVDSSNHIGFCSSSRRYKSNINPFNSGLNLINRLHPVSFNWKTDSTADFGLVAEDVAAAEPLLVTHNDKGQVEGVKYDRLGVVLINAVKEQQGQIEAQQKQIEEQQQTIKRQHDDLEQQKRDFDGLKRFVCSRNAKAAICRSTN